MEAGNQSTSHWWSTGANNTGANPTSSPVSNSDISAPYVSSLNGYPEGYAMSSPQFATEFQHDNRHSDAAMSPASTATSQCASVSGNLQMSCVPRYLPTMPHSPQSVVSDVNFQTMPLDSQMMASPYMSPLPHHQVYILSRGGSLKEPPMRRLSTNDESPDNVRHSWPLIPAHSMMEQSPNPAISHQVRYESQFPVTMDLDTLSGTLSGGGFGGSGFYPSVFPARNPETSRPAPPKPNPRPPREETLQQRPPSKLAAKSRTHSRSHSRSQSQSHPQTQSQIRLDMTTNAALLSKHACPISTCHCTYKRKFELDRHLQEKHGPNSGRLLCPGDMCPRGIPGEGFDRMAHLVNHLISGKHNWSKEQAVYAARKFNPKKGGAGVRVTEQNMSYV